MNQEKCCEKCRYIDSNNDYEESCLDASCPCHTSPKEEVDFNGGKELFVSPKVASWEERLKDLKCINGAMYFGSVDEECDCGESKCKNHQTYEHAMEELKSFISSTIKEERELLIGKIEKARTKFTKVENREVMFNYIINLIKSLS